MTEATRIPITPSGPGTRCVAVTASDATSYTFGCARALYVGGAGNVVVVNPDNTTCTFTGVPAGTILPVYHKRVNSTNTTATSMVAIV